MVTSIKLPQSHRTDRWSDPVMIVGAGIAGLAAALRLSAQGVAVTVIEKADQVGGKIRQVQTVLGPIDEGPTVFTMRWVFERLFSEANESLDDYLASEPFECLAHHRWPDGSRLNLYSDPHRSREAIAQFAGRDEARSFDRFRRDAQQQHDILLKPFMEVDQPGLGGLVRGLGISGLLTLCRTSPFRTLHQQLKRYFRDPRLLQLFSRHATYCGASPYAAPASLALIAHVEQAGVWRIEGGMGQLALALRKAAERKGVQFVFNETVNEVRTAHGAVSGIALASGESLACSELILNADVNALQQGLFGQNAAAQCGLGPRQQRSLSAITWSGTMKAGDVDLHYHNVFFSHDYDAEFQQLFARQQVPETPTVYLCAPDRAKPGAVPETFERMFVLINAPATGDQPHARFTSRAVKTALESTLRQIGRCGVRIELDADGITRTQPADFHHRFPATGGALYGAATHGWRAAFQRPGNRTRVKGLYLAGGSVHPGPGVPMAALSGMSAAASVLADREQRAATTSPRMAHA